MSEETLLAETINDLQRFGKSSEDVFWVGSTDGVYAISWSEFAEIANISYDSGFGSQEIAKDLVVVANGWWLERSEYDGSESWTFQTQPIQSSKPKRFNSVRNGDSWSSIEEMNRPGGKYGEQ